MVKLKSKAVFLDRDGVINKDKGYVYKIKDFKFIPGIFEFLRLLQSKGFKLFVITNQSGIGRKYYTTKDFNKLNKYMLDKLKEESIIIEKVYFCPHKPENNCKCRKPSIFFIKEAEGDYNLNLRNSWVIGDKASDIEMGKKAGCWTLLIDSNYKNIVKAIKNKEIIKRGMFAKKNKCKCGNIKQESSKKCRLCFISKKRYHQLSRLKK
jgi:D-glycero-D-manno-heptose 1,7-bisphosphate phosphatase